jgi:hypothetical protein
MKVSNEYVRFAAVQVVFVSAAPSLSSNGAKT